MKHVRWAEGPGVPPGRLRSAVGAARHRERAGHPAATGAQVTSWAGSRPTAAARRPAAVTAHGQRAARHAVGDLGRAGQFQHGAEVRAGLDRLALGGGHEVADDGGQRRSGPRAERVA